MVKEVVVESSWKENIFGLLTCLSFVALVLFSRSQYAHDLGMFYLLMGVAYLLVFGFFAYLWKYNKDVSVTFVFAWAAMFHLLGVFGAPLFEDDYYRYVWDAYHTVQFGSPYGVAPSDYFDENGLGGNVSEAFRSILNGINYPDIPTIYGPTLQYSFLLAYFIAPGEVWALQLVYSVVDLLLIWMLFKFASPRLVMLYAWSPLVFKEVLLTAHPDGLGVSLLILAVLCFYRKSFYLMAIALAASLAAKIFAILFVPFLLFKTNVRVITLFSLSVLLLYLPLLGESAGDLLGLNAMAQNWQFNAALYGVLTHFFSADISKLILALVLVVGFSWYFLRFHFGQNPLSKSGYIRGDLVMGGFLLCAPVINPWYLIWVLPFAVIHKNISVWVASVMVMLAYLVGLNIEGSELAAYQQPLWARVVEFGVILACVLTEAFLRRRGTSVAEEV